MELTFLQRSFGSVSHALWELAWRFCSTCRPRSSSHRGPPHTTFRMSPSSSGRDKLWSPQLVNTSLHCRVLLPGRLWQGTTPLLHVGFSGGSILCTSSAQCCRITMMMIKPQAHLSPGSTWHCTLWWEQQLRANRKVTWDDRHSSPTRSWKQRGVHPTKPNMNITDNSPPQA